MTNKSEIGAFDHATVMHGEQRAYWTTGDPVHLQGEQMTILSNGTSYYIPGSVILTAFAAAFAAWLAVWCWRWWRQKIDYRKEGDRLRLQLGLADESAETTSLQR